MIRALILPLAYLPLLASCDDGAPQGQSAAAPAAKPNILLVVWDTVRTDRLSLYGHGRLTTPYLDEWAKEARVFENCLSVGSNTVPSHAAMFTGLFAAEHGVTNEQPYLAEQFETLAELLHAAGYSTYLFSENPHICARNNFTQGFDVAEHPWSPQYQAEAIRLTRRKLDAADLSSELPEDFKQRRLTQWSIKAAGRLAQQGALNWLSQQDRDRPFFIFLNYMEAHRPLIPPRRYRRPIMTPDEVEASYRVDRRWESTWSYVFRLHEYTPAELELTRATYDAALLELDHLFHNLLEGLRTGGYLEKTLVVLVSDHGEHLGEHHMFDHQYSVYEPLVRIPLVVHYPTRLAPGREQRPVMNLDLFPTLLELAGIHPPVKSKAVSLLRPLEKRLRMSEYPAIMREAFERERELYPDFDSTPWNRTLRAYYDEPHKFIEASDGHHELYNLDDDPGELRNLLDEQPQLSLRLAADLQHYVRSLKKITTTQPQRPSPPMDEAHQRRLEALGYLSTPQDTNEEGDSKRPEQNDEKP
ncbi:MAG: sulfatase [Phycisphaerae bacterium]